MWVPLLLWVTVSPLPQPPSPDNAPPVSSDDTSNHWSWSKQCIINYRSNKSCPKQKHVNRLVVFLFLKTDTSLLNNVKWVVKFNRAGYILWRVYNSCWATSWAPISWMQAIFSCIKFKHYQIYVLKLCQKGKRIWINLQNYVLVQSI